MLLKNKHCDAYFLGRRLKVALIFLPVFVFLCFISRIKMTKRFLTRAGVGSGSSLLKISALAPWFLMLSRSHSHRRLKIFGG